ncbi:ABC transporter permease subunit [Streptomyces chryseus]|uniref:ABC transporter permease subunit n=1 Tax=Streptomyces chryseus TaxID=68186 RepID=UPI00110FC72C|nr:ABC transporter permease subunit [Streptomyces chryseus]
MTTSTHHTAAPRRARASGGGLPGAVAAEWSKLWSVKSTWWSLIGGGALMLLTAPIIGSTMANNKKNSAGVAVGEVAVNTVYVAQFALIALSMLVITAEYTSGSIRTTLQAVPRRGQLLLAKSLVAGVVSLLGGIALGLIGVGVSSMTLGDKAIFDSAEAFGSALRMGVYLALISSLTIGVAVAVRSAAGTLTIVFVGLTVMPVILQASDMGPLVYLSERMPNSAGTIFMNAADKPYAAGTAFVILALWAVAVQAAGYQVLRKRDA